MGTQLDFIFWKILRSLVVEHNYRLINISGDHSEVWLEPFRNKYFQLVRFVRKDIDWGNWISQDIEHTAHIFETIRKQSMRRDLNILNIYVTTFPPVDDWEFRIKEPFAHGKTVVKTMLLDQEHIMEKTGDLEDALSASLKKLDYAAEEPNFESVERIKEEIFSYIKRQERLERSFFENGRPFFTYVFLTAQIVMFFLLEWYGGSTNSDTLIKFGAKYNPAIYDGEWWRFFSPILLHIGFLHLIMNSLALYYIGMTVEKMYGSIRFLLIYLFAGFTGSLASFAFSPFLSAGASGAIFGLFGALLFLGVLNPKLFFRTIGPNILIVVLINLMLGWAIPNVDNAGHIGGLIGGFLAAFVLQIPRMSKFFTRAVGIILSIIFVFGLGYYGYEIAPKRNSEMALARAQALIENKEFQKASEVLSEAKELDDAKVEIIYLLAYTEYRLNNVASSIEYLNNVLEKDPTFHQAYYVLSLIYAEQNDVVKAQEAIDKALKLDPGKAEYQQLKQQLDNL